VLREAIGRAFGLDPGRIICGAGSDEILNLLAHAFLRHGDEAISTTHGFLVYPIATMANGAVNVIAPETNFTADVDAILKLVTPRTKLILLCHITNRTGQIFPVKRICQMAHSRNIPVIVDGAHAFSHFPFKISDLDCDYYGTSLHKWTYAPVGTGFLYVRKSRIASTWSMMASDEKQAGDIRKFEEIGTHPAANHNAISEALLFNENLGIDRKAARLRYMRDRWANRLAQHPKCRILHSPDPAQSCGIGFLSFAEGVDAGKMRETLYNKYNIITAYMPHKLYSGLRITPNVYSTIRDIDYFSEVVEKEL